MSAFATTTTPKPTSSSKMVLIGEQKFACETCIKGHRSSTCNHADRPLLPIKRKGRPTTQCDHCRELRRTRRVHVKCVCGLKPESGALSKPGKASPESPLPVILPKQTAAIPALSDGGSSDSDHSACNCGVGQECHCCIPRQAEAKKVGVRKTRSTRATRASPASSASPGPMPWSDIEHDVSSVNRHQHAHHSTDPYGHAYTIYRSNAKEAAYAKPELRIPHLQPYQSASSSNANLTLPSLQLSTCSCVFNCGCPGCTSPHTSPNAESCESQRSACNSCIDCSFLSSLSQYDIPQAQIVDNWLRSVPTGSLESSFPDFPSQQGLLPDPLSYSLDSSVPPLQDYESQNMWPSIYQDSSMFPMLPSYPPYL